jgi:hypothetical protein
MPIEITSLTQLNPAKVQEMLATLSQLMAERHPEVELTRGVFHDLVLYFDALLNAAIQENIARVQQSSSLLKITQDPTLADPDIVDQVLSNFNVQRDNGTPAVGSITIVFNADVRTEIPANVRFSIDGAETVFVPTDTFVVLPTTTTEALTGASQRKMIPVGDGTFAATVTVIAQDVGAAGNIKRGVNLIPDNVLNNVAAAFAAADFIDGRDPATNEEYLARLATGLAAKTVGSRASYIAAVMAQPSFKNTKHLSVLGCGDAEQQRDQHSLFPISSGGKVDIYAQTNAYAQEIEHLLEATYIGPYTPPAAPDGDCAEQALAGGTPTGTVWQVAISRNAAPGFYEITNIVDPVAAGPQVNYSVLQDTRSADFLDLDFVPDVIYLQESAYTRYQTAIIRFVNTDIQPTAALVPNQTKKWYAVTTTGMPLIAELQDYFSGRDTRPRATDVLIKAAVPCFTKISFEIRKSPTAAVPDIAVIQKSVSDAVASVGFTGQLHASVISNAAHKHLTSQQALGSIDMFGRIRRPDGSTAYVRDNTILQLPHDVARLVTGRTTVFLTRPQDVSVAVVSAGWAS